MAQTVETTVKNRVELVAERRNEGRGQAQITRQRSVTQLRNIILPRPSQDHTDA